MFSSRMTHLSLAILACLEPLSHRTLCSPTIIPLPPANANVHAYLWLTHVTVHLTRHSDHCVISFAFYLSCLLACLLARVVPLSSSIPAFMLTLRLRPRPFRYLTLLCSQFSLVLWFMVLSISHPFRSIESPCAGLAILNYVLTFVSALARGVVIGTMNRYA